ncbi:hypothetical protein PZT66_24020 [Pseudomonas aeruginosa]|uniref:hypothetical protein n=1 Tax=Pseudomonas aeruginosa group TaxID=136841 RepID=UPI0003BB1255|nr:hypothetical protein [Pseudomonas aeruginosa]EIU2716066.1 hypothetical protein [Pseudomonas aeruginosa]EIU2863643.1 hypothetical protein [Pseudomonas aeruginosa]ELD5772855.1 hypothetical protein [Pseudomonas aeruginosa]ERW61319.1 hypothetical protein Q024_06366 [Pseudomonas aeruginosa BWHPSA011]ETV28792.1 hypothetical protein Q046_05709 [Pseudomonas aeruginosa BWHPSA041]
MSKELHDLLATAAADYRARGDLAAADQFDSILASQVSAHEDALRKENEALRICYGDQQNKRLAAELELNELKIEHGSIQARVAEFEANLLRSAEGTDILGGVISSIEKHGNYSAESTVVVLRQALGCFNRSSPVSDAPVKGEVSRDE